MKQLIIFLFILTTMAFFDIRLMRREGGKKEIVVYSFFMLIAIALGFIYFKDPYCKSIASIVLDIFKIKG
jgi:hypothetical protein